MERERAPILAAGLDKREVQAVYGRVARGYDLWAWLTESRARQRCLEIAAIRDGEAVLEVAVGTGLAFVEVLKANPHGRNEGIDLTEAMLSRARDKAAASGVANYHLSVGDAYDLAYPDGTFDLLLNNYMFDLLPEADFAVVLGEFKRVLRAGGRLVMINMTRGEQWSNALWEGLYRLSPALLGGCRGVQLLPYVEAAGFTAARRETVSQLTFPSEIIAALKPG